MLLNSSKDNFKNLFSLIRPFKYKIILVLLLLLLSAGVNIYIPLLNQKVMDYGFLVGDYKYVIQVILLIFFLKTFIIACDLVKEITRADISSKATLSLYKAAI
ncbi:hypothetical protein [Paenibacillus sp. YN15]|uniref:hypothetical protein n=1 Tax=Paenibacillus sp. YN15 TaxID=1742774 RepID=UPI000DCDC05E|nr:hypothetical protein [Paenibacillus sp. YN15]RAU90923.1 hypothetical protein DQG13_30170 [Paenibacillus sp. YN15]